jgi:dihydrofolate synthase/folylpolyglutamate synthase
MTAADPLSDWLLRLQSRHPREIDLGLDRVRAVSAALGLQRPAPKVVTVAGTNGKGSCCALIDALARSRGLRTGLYTSPHLRRFNERIRIDGRCASDAEIVAGFERVEAARGDVSLTYFEVATLAALLLFEQADLDLAVLEVGMGGRLDAVNIVDPDVPVITSIALDHQEWLGPDIETIAGEKAGILRAGRSAVYGEAPLPASVARRCAELPCDCLLRDRDFGLREHPAGWDFWGRDAAGSSRWLEGLPRPAIMLDNATAALQAALLLDLLPPRDRLEQTLRTFSVDGRRQRGGYRGLVVLLDVAHNPAASEGLARYVSETGFAPCRAVFGVLADKERAAMIEALGPHVEGWIATGLPGSDRSLPGRQLARELRDAGARVLHAAEDPAAALDWAARHLPADSRLLVFGSFLTVGPALEVIEAEDRQRCTSA